MTGLFVIHNPCVILLNDEPMPSTSRVIDAAFTDERNSYGYQSRSVIRSEGLFYFSTIKALHFF